MKIKFIFVLLLSSFLAPFAFADEVGDISYRSQNSLLKRREPLVLTGFSFGPKWLLTHSTNSSTYFSLSVAGHREVVEVAELNYRITGGFNSKFTGYEVQGTIGASWLPLKGNFSPYLGFDFGGGFATFVHQERRHFPFGFVGGLRTGMRMFRLSKNQLDLSVAGSFLFRNVDGSMPFSLDIRLALLI